MASPDGEILSVSGPLPGAVHDLTAARIWGIVRELAACGLIVLADKGYAGAGENITLPTAAAASPPRRKTHVELQKLLDEANAWSSYSYEKGTYVAELSDEVIDVITDQVPRKTSPMSLLLFYRLDGAYCRAGDDETAFSGGRSPRYGTFIVGMAPEASLVAAERDWAPGRLGGASPTCRRQRGWVHQRDGRTPGRPGPRELRPRQVRAAGSDQGRVRPGQRVPPERQHPASLTWPARRR
jgi:hypothetical protein